jgi:proteasome lid subunit RPN8/RPN11
VALMRMDGSVYLTPLPNTAADPEHEYEVDTNVLLDATRGARPLWVYHSHPAGPATFSPADLEYAEEMALPQWMYDVPTRTWHEHIPATYVSAKT